MSTPRRAAIVFRHPLTLIWVNSSMDYPLFFEEDLPNNVESKYEAVIVAGIRARELQRGVKTLLSRASTNKATTLALSELREGHLAVDRDSPDSE